MYHVGSRTLYCDEEGKLTYAPSTHEQTCLFHQGAGRTLDVIVGDRGHRGTGRR
jgi:hypothetical protein